MKRRNDVFAALFVLSVLVSASCGPNPKKYETLKNPVITNRESQMMLVAELHGDPNLQTKAVGELFRVWYSLPMKDKRMVAPRARWLKPFNTPKSEWVGLWAMPVPRDINHLPAGTPVNLRLEEWEGGLTAEILHIGPYSTENPDIDRLHAFISNSGYRIAGDHEEEYIVGPGMFGPGDTGKYLTIIRYRVEAVAGEKR
jgi:hypothetical protein